MDKITNINVNGTTYDVDIAVEGGYLSEKYDSDLSELAEITSASLNDLNSRVSAIADKVEDVAEGALVNVQSDWNVTDTSSDAYIKNKPTSPIVEGYLHNGAFYAEKSYDNNGYTYVDLGLPSGTKWATMNVGASSETDYGNYYQYGKGAAQYAATSGDSNYSGTENPLAASADTAVQVWGGQWHMPTNIQVLELIANTTYEWTRINDVNGGKFTAQNGNYVFFPAAGVYGNGASSGVGNAGLYWSSTPNDNDTAYGWNFVRNGVSNSTSSYDRNNGFSVRGVLDTTAVVYTSAITPEVGKIYIDKDTNVQYRWGDALFIELHDTGDSSEITATLSGSAGAYALNTTYRVLTGIKLLRDSKGHVTGATFTALNVKDTNTTYSAGTAALISAGTNTTSRIWSPKILADYVKSMVANATRLCGTFNASTGAIDGGSNTLTSVANTKGDLYLCDTAGTYLGTTFEVGDSLFFKNSVAANTAPTDNDVFSVEATVTVSNANANLSWGTTTTIATVEGVDITVTMPDDPVMDSVTYSELVSLRNNGQLKPGSNYRITDYQCTTSKSNTQSAGHAFDIIVKADSTNKLNENARAILHSGDTYFANSKLEAWKLMYSLDNDTDRFGWADSTNGKGVIYWMKDEFDNECPYDFKNIQFIKEILVNNGTIIDGVFYYTFSVATGTNDATITDHSLNGSYCYSNKIGTHHSSNKLLLNFNIFRNNTNTRYCIYNQLASGCYGNCFGNENKHNILGKECSCNSFENTASNNILSTSCMLNKILGGSYNIFDCNCSYNTLGPSSSHNIFGSNCLENTLSTNCSYNKFENYCCANIFDGNSSYNKFGNFCCNIIFGAYCEYNTLGENCTNIKFGTISSSAKSFCRNIIVENGNCYIYLNCLATTSNALYLLNIKIAQGINNNSSSSVTILHQTAGDAFLTIYKPSNSQIILI